MGKIRNKGTSDSIEEEYEECKIGKRQPKHTCPKFALYGYALLDNPEC